MAKLLMITGLGGVEDLVSGKKGAFYNTLEEFHKHWERIDIISPKVKGQNSGVKNLFGNVYIHISLWPLIFHPIWFLKKGIEIYKEQKFDLMTVHEFPPFYNGIGARLLWQKIKVPYVLEIHHIPGYPESSGVKEEIYKNLTSLFIKYDVSGARAVRVVNLTQVSEFLIKAGVPKEKILYIPSLYIDLDIFKPMNLPKEYDLIFIGRLEKNKGLDLLLETVNNLKSQISNIKCLIIGEGSLKKNLSLEISHLSLQNNVIMHGYARDANEIASLLNQSRLLIMPSYNEGGPRVVVEAMACGVPVLATPVGIVPDLLNKNLFVGRQVASGGEIIDWRPEAIAQKVQELLNLERCGKYSFNGLEIVIQFEKKKAIKNYADK